MSYIEAFKEQVAEYAYQAEQYIADANLPAEWFSEPDHIAIKCADTRDYAETMTAFEPVSRQITSIEQAGRRLGTALLLGAMPVGRLGTVDIIEIMEPRPEKVGQGRIGVEHMEFYYPSFARAEAVLTELSRTHKCDIPYEIDRGNAAHHTLILPFGAGLEIKLNNRTLGEIIPEELAAGVARVDFPAPRM